MSPAQARIAPPSDDTRWHAVDAAMRRNGYQSHALIETLHAVQESFGYLDQDALRYVATALHTPPSHVYAVATFYHHFTLTPPGTHACVVCCGTACHIRDANTLLATIKEQLDVAPGETTADGKISVLVARCIGACSLAPLVILDGKVVGDVTPPQLMERLSDWRDNHG